MSEQNLNDGAIPQIGDRGNVNVKTKQAKKGKMMILSVFIIFSLCLVAGAVFFAIHAISKQRQEEEVELLKMPDESLQTKGAAQDKGIESSMAAIVTEQRRRDEEEENRKASLAEEKQRQAAAEQARLDAQEREKKDQAPMPEPQQAQSGPGGSNEKRPMTPAERKMAGSVLINVAGNNGQQLESGSNGQGQQQQQPQEGGGLLMTGQTKSNSAISDSLRGENYAAGVASYIDNRDYLLIHGTTLPCVLITKIVTSYKGLVKCQLTQDIYSANGKTLLAERGAAIMGEQKVAITQGVARVFINWTEADTPVGIRVRLDSLGTDSLGAAGAEAWIDNHYAERFGGAIMLSFIDDALQTIANKASNTSSDVYYDNSTKNASDMANEALKNSINIPPTAYINQGEMMNVLVARDVDFRNVFQNR